MFNFVVPMFLIGWNVNETEFSINSTSFVPLIKKLPEIFKHSYLLCRFWVIQPNSRLLGKIATIIYRLLQWRAVFSPLVQKPSIKTIFARILCEEKSCNLPLKILWKVSQNKKKINPSIKSRHYQALFLAIISTKVTVWSSSIFSCEHFFWNTLRYLS